MSPSGSKQDALLRAYRIVHSPDEDATRAAYERVRSRIAAGDDVSMPLEVGASRRGLKLTVAALAVAAVALLAWMLDLGAVIGRQVEDVSVPHEAAYRGDGTTDRAAGYAQEPPGDPPRRTAPAEVSPPDDQQPDLVEPIAPEAVVEDDGEPVRRKRATRARTKAKSNTEPAVVDATLHAELALLESAQVALSAGKPSRALAQLHKHAKSFPDSMLAEEREVARIRALCALGRTDEAEAAARRFQRKYPKSPLRGRVASACEEGEAP